MSYTPVNQQEKPLNFDSRFSCHTISISHKKGSVASMGSVALFKRVCNLERNVRIKQPENRRF